MLKDKQKVRVTLDLIALEVPAGTVFGELGEVPENAFVLVTPEQDKALDRGEDLGVVFATDNDEIRSMGAVIGSIAKNVQVIEE